MAGRRVPAARCHGKGCDDTLPFLTAGDRQAWTRAHTRAYPGHNVEWFWDSRERWARPAPADTSTGLDPDTTLPIFGQWSPDELPEELGDTH